MCSGLGFPKALVFEVHLCCRDKDTLSSHVCKSDVAAGSHWPQFKIIPLLLLSANKYKASLNFGANLLLGSFAVVSSLNQCELLTNSMSVLQIHGGKNSLAGQDMVLVSATRYECKCF